MMWKLEVPTLGVYAWDALFSADDRHRMEFYHTFTVEELIEWDRKMQAVMRKEAFKVGRRVM